MPLFQNGKTSFSVEGLEYQARRTAIPQRHSIHFIDRYEGGTLVPMDDRDSLPLGALVEGYARLTPPGYTGSLTPLDSADNTSGWQFSYETSRQPGASQLELNFNNNLKLHRDVCNNIPVNSRFVIRSFSAPPNITFFYSVLVHGGVTFTAFEPEQGLTATVEATPYLPALRVPGQIWESGQWDPGTMDGQISHTGGHMMVDNPGSDVDLNGDGQAEDAGDLTVQIASTGAISLAGLTGTVGDRREARALLMVPGVGYAISEKATGALTTAPVIGDTALGMAILAQSSSFYVGLFASEALTGGRSPLG